jgi:hypothetical protein
MTYQRVIPRDLFNEANLLKCYGQLALKLEEKPGVVFKLSGDYYGNYFDIQQNVDGCLSIDNIELTIKGKRWYLFRPLNSREPWPLYAYDNQGCDEDNTTELQVFTDDGELSAEFLELLSR